MTILQKEGINVHAILLDSLLQHSPCWFLDIQFKEYSSSIQALKIEFSRSIQSSMCNSAGFAKSVPNFKICAQSLNDFNPILLPIHFKHFQQKFFFSRAFQAPLKSEIKFQCFLRTSRRISPIEPY